MRHALTRGAIKGFQFGFGFSIVGHILLLLGGMTDLASAMIDTIVTGVLLWGPLGALLGVGVAFVWQLAHPAPRRPTSLPE